MTQKLANEDPNTHSTYGIKWRAGDHKQKPESPGMMGQQNFGSFSNCHHLTVDISRGRLQRKKHFGFSPFSGLPFSMAIFD